MVVVLTAMQVPHTCAKIPLMYTCIFTPSFSLSEHGLHHGADQFTSHTSLAAGMVLLVPPTQQSRCRETRLSHPRQMDLASEPALDDYGKYHREDVPEI